MWVACDVDAIRLFRFFFAWSWKDGDFVLRSFVYLLDGVSVVMISLPFFFVAYFINYSTPFSLLFSQHQVDSANNKNQSDLSGVNVLITNISIWIYSYTASLPGTTTAHQLVQAIRQKCTADEVLNILNDLPNPENDNEMVEMTYNPLKIDVFVQTLLNLGSKSFSHSFAAIAKFHHVFKVSLAVAPLLIWLYFSSFSLLITFIHNWWWCFLHGTFLRFAFTDHCRVGRGANLFATQFVRAVERSSANDVRADWQIVENTSGWVFGGCHLDFLERDELWLHQNVLVGNSAFDDQENEQACHQVGWVCMLFSTFSFDLLIANRLFLRFYRNWIDRSKGQIVTCRIIIGRFGGWSNKQAKEDRSWWEAHRRNGRKDGREIGSSQCRSEASLFDRFSTFHYDFVGAFGTMRYGWPRFRHGLVSMDNWSIATSFPYGKLKLMDIL